MSWEKENNRLLESFYEHTLFEGFRNGTENFNKLELFIGTKCNLACKYCYLNKYGNELFPKGNVLKNTEALLDWLAEKDMKPQIEIFSGEPLIQESTWKICNMIFDKIKAPTVVVIPTNYTFLLSEKQTIKVEELLEHSRQVGIPVFLSASFDGKFCESNRPFKLGKETRDDDYYDRCFAFNKKWRFGFHPMIYSEKIENWVDNFKWFQGMMKKHNIPATNLYLLEVRNVEWSQQQLQNFMNFTRFLVRWSFQVLSRGDIERWFDFIFKQRGFNFLSSALSTVGRGIGCSIQSTLTVRMSDLTIVPCHRLAYKQFDIAKFQVTDSKITGISAKNPELAIGIMSHEQRNSPFCELCPLKYVCQGGCLGSNYEVTGNPFTPIPTVCKLEHAKMLAYVQELEALGIIHHVYERVNSEKKQAFDFILENT